MLNNLIRCDKCGQINRVSISKLDLKPKCHNCKSTLTILNTPVDVTSNNYARKVAENPGISLVDFWSPTCGFCLKLDPVLNTFAKENAGKINIFKINTAIEQNLSMQFGISGVPALFLFKNGKKIAEKFGFTDKNALNEWVFSYYLDPD